MSTNRQSQRSKQWMIEALYELMKTKPYSAITIKEIADKAGVSRLTFYRNFQSKENILEVNFQNMFRTFLSEIDNKQIYDMKGVLISIFEQFYKNKKHLEILINNHLESILYKPFTGYLDILFDKFNIANKINSTQKNFLAGGLFFTITEWINEENQNIYEIVDSILNIMELPHNTI